MTGQSIGAYRITAKLGAGGMGEVYRARDTKLDREVAIKLLPVALAQDPERLARFEREAKVLAALNHPNIAQIYGLEESDGIRALVMELVPGETLKAPVPLETALNYAKQIADALEAAHEKGITHRDLKPANIMVTPAGVVKVLDFGLAAITQSSAASGGDASNSPTLTMAATQAGMIMGTAAYMSPEQASGKPVDRRADIWAFGVVLCEMLSGKRLFVGETISHTLAAVLTQELDWTRTPAKVCRLVQACLQKDARQRLQAIGDWRLLLEDASPPVEGGQSASGRPVAWMIAVAVLAAALIGVAWIAYRATRPAELKPLVRLEVDLGSDVSLGSVRGADAILSPDGTRLVYVSQGKLFTRKLDQPKATELVGAEGAFAPFFSPDGQWVAFFDGGKLKKISVEGGAPVALCDAPQAQGGSWGEDGAIIAMLDSFGTLSRIPSTGGAPTLVTELAPGESNHRWPQILPGGKAVLFTSITSNGANIEVTSLKDHRRKTLVRGGAFGRYVATSNTPGHLMYMNSGTVFGVAFDLAALEVRGTSVPVLEQVAYNPNSGSAQFDVSSTGTLLYRSGGAAGTRLFTVQWLDRAGKLLPLLAKPGNYIRPRLSPDGQRLALEIPEDIWIYEWQRDTMRRLTFGAGTGLMNPVWSPDGRYIVFEGKGGVIFWTRSDGAGKPQPLTQSKNRQVPFSFAPDGKRLSWFELTASNTYALWTMPLESYGTGLRAGKPEVFLQTSFDERHPAFSPDGRWLAYTSSESGTYEVYVRAFPDRGGEWQISNGGGAYPVWSPTGKDLFFRSRDNRIMVAAYLVKGDSIVVDKPKVWSEKRLADFGIVGTSSYDLAPDGKRAAILMPVETPEAKPQNHVVFLMNFSDELRRRVPVGGK